jgi:hypothetical protein
MFVELVEAARNFRPHERPYRNSRSYRRKKESQDYNNQDTIDYDHNYDTVNQQQNYAGDDEGDTDYHHQIEHVAKPGYSDGSGKSSKASRESFNVWLLNQSEGLRSIAQGSADQANSAVANQELAAKQASYIAQNNLANLALQASATAMAALQGKQVLLAKIEQENLDAHQSLEVELQQLRQAKRSAKAAQQVNILMKLGLCFLHFLHGCVLYIFICVCFLHFLHFVVKTHFVKNFI